MNASSAQLLPGWISTFFVRYNGKKLGPYYARSWKADGKLRREYIRPGELERVRAACQRHRDKRKATIATTWEIKTLLGNLNYLSRTYRRSIKGLLRPEDQTFIDRLEKQGFRIPGRPSLRTVQPKTGNRKPKTFMYPSDTNNKPRLKKADIEAAKKVLNKTIKANRQAEDFYTKWGRWLKELKAVPAPPRNPELALPEKYSKETIAAMLQPLLEKTHGRKLKRRGMCDV
jgi:hypothetical protein